MASDMDAIRARLLDAIIHARLVDGADIRALLAENERLTEALRAATHDEWPEFLEAKAVEVARLTAELAAANERISDLEGEVERLRGELEIEEAHNSHIGSLVAQRDQAEAALAAVDRYFQEAFPDWQTVTPPEGMPLRLFLLKRAAAANERAEKLSSDIQSLLARADAMGAQAANSPGVSDDRYWRSRGFEDLRMGLRAALRPTAPEPEEKP